MTKTKNGSKDWVWMGHPAHFICAQDCRFFMSTKVGKFIVSTVGEYLPDENIREIYAQTRNKPLVGRGDARRVDYMKKIGFESLHLDDWKYETMVFDAVPRVEKNNCCPWKIDVQKNHAEKWYKTAEEAHRGHYKLCNEFALK